MDLGPTSLVLVSREGSVELLVLGEALRPNARKTRRLQRKIDRQRRANNPDNYDAKGRIKKRTGKKQRLQWNSGNAPDGRDGVSPTTCE